MYLTNSIDIQRTGFICEQSTPVQDIDEVEHARFDQDPECHAQLILKKLPSGVGEESSLDRLKRLNCFLPESAASRSLSDLFNMIHLNSSLIAGYEHCFFIAEWHEVTDNRHPPMIQMTMSPGKAERRLSLNRRL